MKKVILALAVLATVAFVSCKKETAATEGTEKAKTEAVKDKKVVESKDMTKFQTLATKGQELAKKAQALTAEGLSESDTKKLNDYMQGKAKELQELTKKMMQ